MSTLPGMPHLGTYRIIGADPPWQHAQFSQSGHGAAKAHYDEMPLSSLMEMPVGALAHPEGALLLLWSTACQEAEGSHERLAASWGFRLTTRLASWVKCAEKCAACDHGWDEHDPPLVNEDAPGSCVCECDAFLVRARRGPGSYSMQGVEDLWLGVKGDTTWSKDRARRDIPEILFAPVGEHSAKPERIYERVEALWPEATPRLELFARRRRSGWFAWGNEAPGCDLVFGATIGKEWPVPKPIREGLAGIAAAIGEPYDIDALKALREDD